MHKFDDIIPPSRRRESEPAPRSAATPRRTHHKRNFPYVTLVVVAVVIAASFGALLYFASARIEVMPKTARADVQGTFTAGSADGQLPYKIVTVLRAASKSVPGTGTKTVTSNAAGTITIYNAQSKEQKLIANTRFTTDGKLMFRIKSPVTVPAGTAAKPGSVPAQVVADQPGASYDVGPSSFTVAAFVNTPQAKLVYARSTSPMTGGASGTVPAADPVAEVEARHEMVTALDADLNKALQEELAGKYAGYLALAGAATTSYTQVPSEPSQTAGMVDVKEQGSVSAVVFQNAVLAKAVSSTIPDIARGGGATVLTSTDGLRLAFAHSFPASEDASFSFTLSGPASLKYAVDTSRLAAAIAGKTKNEALVALTNYPEVDEAKILLRPFWRTNFPEDPASITIVVLEPKR